MNIFSKIRIPKLEKNNFDLSYENKLTAQMGQLIPIVCQECVPGDEFKMSSNILVRFNPLVAPMMHRVDVYTHYFFVPHRLVWDEWEDFITGGEDGLLTPEKPYFTLRDLFKRIVNIGQPGNYDAFSYIGPGSLLDYLGINIGLTKEQLKEKLPTVQSIDESDLEWLDTKIDALALRSYKLIYNEYYRNQNTQPLNDFSRTSGNILSENDDFYDHFTLCWRNWGLDYFTSALPFSQRGPEQVVPVQNFGFSYKPQSYDVVRDMQGNPVSNAELQSASEGKLTADLGNSNLVNVSIDNTQNLESNGSASISIRDLRASEKIQEFLERSARCGSRYIEQIKGHFGVFSSDKRMQRPEYLGGGKQVVQISAVDQTSATDISGSTSPLGSYAGKALSGGTTNQFYTKEIEEHGFIIGIMSILPKGGYHQGLSRKFTRFDKLDYFFPEFQNLGDQEIKMKELYFAQSFNKFDNPEVGFGYTPRYAEYKINSDEVHGDFKTTLEFWHLNRKFDSQPRLNGNFSSTQNTIRQDIFAVQEDANGNKVPNVYVDIYNNIKARRPMFYYDNPSL